MRKGPEENEEICLLNVEFESINFKNLLIEDLLYGRNIKRNKLQIKFARRKKTIKNFWKSKLKIPYDKD